MMTRLHRLFPLLLIGLLSACLGRPTPLWTPPAATEARVPRLPTPSAAAAPYPALPPTRGPGTPIWTPTPDPPRTLPTPIPQGTYVVQPGDTLADIARRYHLPMQRLMEANGIEDPNLLAVGQTLILPPPVAVDTAPALKLLPDAELVYGPYAGLFDLYGFIARQPGLIRTYREVVDGDRLSAADIVQRVALEYSVSPRVLLALLEYTSGWVTQADVPEQARRYPMGLVHPQRQGLWKQLSWAANELNRGFYVWEAGGVPGFPLSDGAWVEANPRVNAGTAALHHFFGLIYGHDRWRRAVGEQGFLAVYQRLFGWPFDASLDPLVPPDLRPPRLQLPFPEGATWYFTGGPHPAWGSGTPWAALDFAPGDGPLGCYLSPSWTTAAASGLVVRSRNGVVALDLDMDGYEQTGWVLVYLHVAAQDRVEEGTVVAAGDPLGHPSCEGGVATGTHVHFAWKYNGRWMPAFGDRGIVLSGWKVRGTNRPYEGTLERNGQVVHACACKSEENAITHEQE